MLIAFVISPRSPRLAHEVIVGLGGDARGVVPGVRGCPDHVGDWNAGGISPRSALTLLVGFSAATGPAFADMGYDLKAGYMLRGNGADPAFELEGTQAAIVRRAVRLRGSRSGRAGRVSKLSRQQSGRAGRSRFYAATIKAGASMDVARQLLM